MSKQILSKEQMIKIAMNLQKEFGIDLFDEEGYVEEGKVRALVTIVALASAPPLSAQERG